MSDKKPQNNKDKKNDSSTPSSSSSTPPFPPKLLEPAASGCSKETDKPSCPVSREAIDSTASNNMQIVSGHKCMNSSQNEPLLNKLDQQSTTSTRKSRNSNQSRTTSQLSKRFPTKFSSSKLKDNNHISRKRKINEESAVKENVTAGPSTSTNNEQDDKEGDKDAKKKKNRCAVCRKKVGLTGFECRCGGLYCAVHRYSDKHDCTFDYREHGAQEIRRNNPVVVGEKIQKI